MRTIRILTPNNKEKARFTSKADNFQDALTDMRKNSGFDYSMLWGTYYKYVVIKH